MLSSGYGGANLLANWFNEGTGWSSATPIRATGSGAQWARAAVDPAGHAFAVWWEENPSAAFVAQFTEDSTAVEARRLDSGAGGVGPEVAVDSEGNAIVAWGQGRYEASGVWVNRYIDPQSKVSRIPILPVTFVAMTGLVGTCATAWWWRRAVRPPRAEAAS